MTQNENPQEGTSEALSSEIVPQALVVPQVRMDLAPEKAADAACALLDAREKVARKLRAVAIARTQASDYVDQDGKPHMQAVGVERIRSLFGVSVLRSCADEKSWEDAEDGSRFYTWTAHVKAIMRDPLTREDMAQEATGSCSSRDKFLGKSGGKFKAWDEVDEYSVHAKAVTRGERNAVLRLLGLRGLTWADLEAAGIVRGASGMATVTHATGKEGGSAPDPSTEAQHNAIKALAGKLGDHAKTVWQRAGVARPDKLGGLSAVDAGKVISTLQTIEAELNTEAAKAQVADVGATVPEGEPY